MAEIDDLFQAALGLAEPWQVVRTELDAQARRLDLLTTVDSAPLLFNQAIYFAALGEHAHAALVTRHGAQVERRTEIW